MAKWPDVPHCYGWLGLDARGNWRMRDERAQHLGLAGDKVMQPALLAFINRNYMADQNGNWYFQNGPQRVYVNLEATPYIARTDPVHGLMLHTGDTAGTMSAAWLTENGELIVEGPGMVAQLDDRDMAQMMAALELDGAPVTDEALMGWLEDGSGLLTLRYRGQPVPVERIARADLETAFNFVRQPEP